MKKTVTAIIIIFFLLLFGCNDNVEKISQIDERETLTDDVQEEITNDINNQLNELKVSQCEGEQVFSLSICDFITEFNEECSAEFGEGCLKPANQWNVFEEKSIFTGNEAIRREFKTSQNNYIEPTIWITTLPNDDRIILLSIQFDDHGYAEWAYDVYKDYSIYTMRVFFEDMEDYDIEKLFEKLNDAAYSDDCYVSPGTQPEPKIIYYKDNVGMFAYYKSGMVHFCIIPITQESLGSFLDSGAKIYGIEC